MEKKPSTLKTDSTNNGQTEVKDMEDMANMIQNMLQKIHENFQVMSDQIINRIDEMDLRIDDLEQNLNELIHQSGIIDESQNNPNNTTRSSNSGSEHQEN